MGPLSNVVSWDVDGTLVFVRSGLRISKRDWYRFVVSRTYVDLLHSSEGQWNIVQIYSEAEKLLTTFKYVIPEQDPFVGAEFQESM